MYGHLISLTILQFNQHTSIVRKQHVLPMAATAWQHICLWTSLTWSTLFQVYVWGKWKGCEMPAQTFGLTNTWNYECNIPLAGGKSMKLQPLCCFQTGEISSVELISHAWNYGSIETFTCVVGAVVWQSYAWHFKCKLDFKHFILRSSCQILFMVLILASFCLNNSRANAVPSVKLTDWWMDRWMGR